MSSAGDLAETGACVKHFFAICDLYRYQIMMSCWAANPDDRPSFTDLRNDLERMLEADDELYISVHCEDYDYYCVLGNDNVSSSNGDENPATLDNNVETQPFI